MIRGSRVAVALSLLSAAACSNNGIITGGGNGAGPHRGIHVGPVSGATTEAGGQATFSVVLESQPGDDVTVHFASSDVTEGLVNTTALTFTRTNWNAPQTVVCTGVDDLVDDGDQIWSVHFLPTVSNDANYAQILPEDVPITNVDNDTAGITVSAVSNATSESGAQAHFTVVLNSQPTADVVVPLDSNDATEGLVDQTSLTFTTANWNAPQTVTITGVDDALADGNQVYTIGFNPATSGDARYNGMTPLPIPVTNIDNDTAGIVVSEPSGPTTEAGGTATFTVVLTSQPAAGVTVHFDTNNASEGTPDVTSLPFTTTNWNVPQTVTVTGVDDLVADGNQPYAIVFTAATSADAKYAGLTPANVLLTNLDNETAGILVSAISGPTSEAGGTATFTVTLQSKPLQDVTVTFDSNDTGEGTVNPKTMTFTAANWNTPQPATVTGVDDAIADGNQPYAIVFNASTSVDPNYNGITPANVLVTNLDNDTAAIRVSAISGPTTEAGGTASFSIVLGSQPGGPVTVPFASSDLTEGTVSAASVSFTTSNWNVPQTVTVTGVDDFVADGDVTYAVVFSPSTSLDPAYSGVTPPSVNVVNVDDDTVGIDVSAISGPTTESGGTATFSVVLHSQPTASVTLNYDSDDATEGTVAPKTMTFTTGNWNVAQSATVTGVDDLIVDGNIVYHVVFTPSTSADAAYNGVTPASIAITNIDNDSATPTPTPTACANGGWASKATMTSARSDAMAASNDGVLYVAGGNGGAGDTATLFAYRASTNSWSTLTSMPAGRYQGDGAAFINGKMYVVGGWTTSPGLPHSEVFVYDPVANSWGSAASMSHLAGCGAVGVINGKLYASTSCNGSSGYANYFEAYDPVANSWSTLASPPHTHGATPAAGVIAGKFYLAGGVDGAGSFQPGYLDVYDPATNTWTTKTALPEEVYGVQAAVHDGRLYVAGGFDNTNTELNTVQVYDPSTDTWTTDTPLISPTRNFTMAEMDGTLYAVGGYNGAVMNNLQAFTACPSGNWVQKASFSFITSTPAAGTWSGTIDVIGGYDGSYLNQNDQYAVATDTWSSKAAMPTNRNQLAYATVNGITYVIGGSASGFCTGTVEAYDASANTWSTKASMPTARCWPAAAALDGKIYVMGGSQTSGPVYQTLEIYDVASNSWSTGANMPTARSQFGAAAADGKIYAVGGYNGGYLNTVEVYDPLANSWSTGPSLQQTRAQDAVVARDGKVWALGGFDGVNDFGTTEFYDPLTSTWTFGPALLKTRAGGAAVVVSDTIYVMGGSDGVSAVKTMEALAP